MSCTARRSVAGSSFAVAGYQATAAGAVERQRGRGGRSPRSSAADSGVTPYGHLYARRCRGRARRRGQPDCQLIERKRGRRRTASPAHRPAQRTWTTTAASTGLPRRGPSRWTHADDTSAPFAVSASGFSVVARPGGLGREPLDRPDRALRLQHRFEAGRDVPGRQRADPRRGRARARAEDLGRA